MSSKLVYLSNETIAQDCSGRGPFFTNCQRKSERLALLRLRKSLTLLPRRFQLPSATSAPLPLAYRTWGGGRSLASTSSIFRLTCTKYSISIDYNVSQRLSTHLQTPGGNFGLVLIIQHRSPVLNSSCPVRGSDSSDLDHPERISV
jgi:hypothetical protein